MFLKTKTKTYTPGFSDKTAALREKIGRRGRGSDRRGSGAFDLGRTYVFGRAF